MNLRLNAFLPRTEVEGPGIRAALWVQGCPIQCPGCAVPWTWDEQGGFTVTVDEIATRILASTDIEGVTFLGGEPFMQAKSLAALGRLVQQHGLSVMTFSGFTLKALKNRKLPDADDLLEVTDLLIDGPFIATEKDFSRPWVGSSNQQFHFLSERYRHLEKQLARFTNGLEIRLMPNGGIFINGMMEKEMLDVLKARL